MGQLRLPEGKRIAVNLGVDFDAQSLWLGAFNMPTPAMTARGQFGAEVGVPRILELYRKYDIRSTFAALGLQREHTRSRRGVRLRLRLEPDGAVPRAVPAAAVDDDEDRRKMQLEDVRGVEPPPVGSGWR